MTQSLYEQILGDAFHRLDAPVQAFHRLAGRHVLQGVVRVDGSLSPLARLVGRRLGAPAVRGQGPMRFALEASPSEAHWTRTFPAGETLVSRSAAGSHGLVEQLGPVRLDFALEVADGRLVMHLRAMRLWGVHCPAWALPQVIFEESGRGGRLHFLVRAALPLVGQVTAYTGYLELPQDTAGLTRA